MDGLRSLARSIPGLASAWRGLRRILEGASVSGRGRVFGEIFRSNAWGSDASRSGSGSDLKQTQALRAELPRLCVKYEITSMLDVPCGDLNWMRLVDLPGVEYVGADIVPELVLENRDRYARTGRRFEILDLCQDTLPQVDMVFCRDCLVHLCFADIERALQNICLSGAKYLLTTTFDAHPDNPEIKTGDWRPLDLTRAPFYLPAPVELLNECCTEEGGRYADKSLGLWSVEQVTEALANRRTKR